MNTQLQISTLIAFATLAACDTVAVEKPTIFEYTSPDASGLSAVRPYPNPDDVCQLLAPNANTQSLVTEGRALIACPKHEEGAIEDRRRDGARVVANATHWVILSVRAPR